VTSIREYDNANGRLLRAFQPHGQAAMRQPRGLRFGPDHNLYCVTRDGVVSFDFHTGALAREFVRLDGLFGQAVVFFG
jgi:hypothetical protein